MSNQNSVKIKPIRLKKKEESMEVFPISERVSMDLSEDEVLAQCEEMGMESVVLNGILPYRDALHTLEKRYLEEKETWTQMGFEMITEPFIPQYLGFEEVELDGPHDICYSKEDVACFLMNEEWYISKGDNPPLKFTIDNMLHGYHVLKGMGANVSIGSYLDAE